MDSKPRCLVLFEIRGVDRPPDQEWFGLLERYQARPVETIEEMLERKFWLKNRIEREYDLTTQYWNEDCKKACQKVDEYIKKLSCNTTTDIKPTIEESCSEPILNS